MLNLQVWFRHFIFWNFVATIHLHAALTWPDCPDLVTTDFKTTTLVSRSGNLLAEPMKMAFDLVAAPGEDAQGKVDIYFTERLGNIRKYDAKTGKVSTLATIELNIDEANSSDGVMGIALDPLFKTNHMAYIYYTYVSAAEKNWRVSRFTLNATNTVLDLSSELVVLKIPIKSGSKHPGGALQFDASGDLWVTTGNDSQTGNDFPMFSSPNTNDLRGKILRIHPTADGKYTIPSGNLFPSGTANTRPEIYIMGNRNPYTLALDPVRKWVFWGDIGPDFVNADGKDLNAVNSPENTEEFDLATAPGNYGYPFFSGDFATKPGSNAAAPTIPTTYGWEGAQPGKTSLPPAIAPIYVYKKACAITGPLYRYDGDLNSSVKFPPHFQRKWLVTDFNPHSVPIKVFTLTDDGTKLSAQDSVLGVRLDSPLDLQFGPDGALYANNYAGYRTSVAGTSLIRIEYIGKCRPTSPKLETLPQVGVRGVNRWNGPGLEIIQAREVFANIISSGAFNLQVFDIMGRPLSTYSGQGKMRLDLPEVTRSGIYFISLESSEGTTTRKIIRQ